MADRKCISVQGFWQNNLPGGIWVILQDPDLTEVIDLIDKQSMALVDTRALASDVLQFLQVIGRRILTGDAPEGQEVKVMCLAAITYLEDTQNLASDEYNGMIYFYLDTDGITVIRSDKPPSRIQKID